MLASTAEILDNADYSKQKEVELFLKLSRFKEYGIEHNDLSNEYLRIINLQLINRGNVTQFKKASNLLLENIEDSLLQSDIRFYYNYELSRYYYNKGFYSKSFPFAENAVSIRSSNIDAQSLFISNVFQDIQDETSGDVVFKKLQDYTENYTFLAEHELFITLKMQALLLLVIQSYDSNDRISGDKNLHLFEETYAKKDIGNVDKSLIANAYSSAAMYYFRKYNVKKSKSLLRSGLKFVPNNFDLQTRLNQISNY